MSRYRLLCTVLFLTACTETAPDITGIGDRARQLTSAEAAKSGGGSAVYAYTLTGDIFTPTAPTQSTAKAQATNPFFNLSTSPVTVKLGTPSGDSSKCQAGGAGPFSPDFGAVAGSSWVGTLKIASTGTLSFLGTRVGGSDNLQFSVGDMTEGPGLSISGGTATYAYTDASLYFGSGGVGHDGQYRCVNLTVTAAQQ